jgi:hypothetical protein
MNCKKMQELHRRRQDLNNYGSETFISCKMVGCAIAQAVSRWLPTAATRLRARSGHVGFAVNKLVLGQPFSAYLGFPCQSSFHQILHHHNHPGQVQWANWWLTCRVDPVWLRPPVFKFKKIYDEVRLILDLGTSPIPQRLVWRNKTRSSKNKQ